MIEVLLDYATRLAGVFALLIIAIPRLTELVLSRYFSRSLEQQKQALQIEVEKIKSDLAKSIETHKAILQQDQIVEQRRYAEDANRKKEAALHTLGTLEKLLTDIRKMVKNLNDPPPVAYEIVNRFLTQAYSYDLRASEACRRSLAEIEEECERPGGMADSNFSDGLRDRLSKFAVETEGEIARMKRGGGEP